MKELSLKKLENLEGGKFWGRETNCVYGLCTKTCYTTRYRVWIGFTSLASFENTCN